MQFFTYDQNDLSCPVTETATVFLCESCAIYLARAKKATGFPKEPSMNISLALTKCAVL